MPPDLVRVRMAAEIDYIGKRWHECVRVASEADGHVTEGGLLNMEAVLGDTRALFSRMSAVRPATDQPGSGRPGPEAPQAVGEAHASFQDLAERCGAQLSAIYGRVHDGRRVTVATVRGLAESFTKVEEFLEQYLGAEPDLPQDGSGKTPAVGSE